MAIDRRDDLEAFRDFVDAKLDNGGAALSPADCLDLWEVENPPEDERESTVAALREALQDMKAGDAGQPIADFLAELRQKHGLPGAS